MTRDELLQSKQELEQANLRRFPRYSEYDESGIHWFGEKPSHWRIRRLKHVSSVKFSNVDKHTIEGEEPVRLCNYTDVYYNDHIHEAIDFMDASATEQEIKKFKIKKDDVIITKDSEDWDDIAIPAYVITDFEDVLCGYHLALMRANEKEMFGKYLFRSFQARGINDQFRVASNGITRYGLGKYGLDNGFFLVPPIPEQKAIASFLDRETERIDRLIEKKRRLIELLKEKRTALISHAVTKGLNPDAPMKPSGIDWLGDVPEHWEVDRLKFFTSINDETLPENTDPTYELLYIDIGSVDRSKGIQSKQQMLFEDAPSRARRIVRNGDTIVSTVRTYLRAIATIKNAENNLICSTGFAVVRPKKIEDNFLSYLLRSNYFVESVVSLSVGVSYPAINSSRLSGIYLPMPPEDEQNDISLYLDEEIPKINQLVKRIEDALSHFSEYRSALISAAVTGKIDVRGEVNED